MLANSLVQLTFKETVQGFFFGVADHLIEAFDGNAAAVVVSDLQVLTAMLHTCRVTWEQVSNLLVVDLCVTDSDSDGLVELVLSEGIELGDGARDHTTVLKLSVASSHRVGLASACLPVAEHCAIVALNDALNDLGCGHFVSFILASVVQNTLEVELPHVGLVVDHTKSFILVLLERDRSRVKVNIDIFAGEVCGGPCSNDHFHGLFGRHIYCFLIFSD